MIKKILIANRGEIALRIQRTAKKMDIKTVAIYAQTDAGAAFVTNADEAILLDGTSLSETYLNIEKIINAAIKNEVDAIHPGYGFLSENASFVKACEKAGITFIGPSATAMNAMGNKIMARENAVKANVPVTPGITGTPAELLKQYATVGFPILIKAAAGGGGKGMRVVNNEEDLNAALEATAREAKNYFGDDTVYIEKYIEQPRHIEVQVLGDQHGNLIHLYERECSLQRRHQKIIEEAPSSTLPDNVREKICSAAVTLAKSINYYNAGTMEFLLDEQLNFYFLEMNTRIQVEHPVTELTTSIDIVEQQIHIANGATLSLSQNDIHQKGHAIECRIYAEDPAQHFLPSPGKINYYQEPTTQTGNHIIRIDGMQLESGDTVSGDFDPMISKLIVWSHTREQARMLMIDALQQYHINGIQTNIHFLTGLLQHPDFINNNISTKYIDNNIDQLNDYINRRKQEADITVPLAATLIKSLERKVPPDNIWQTIGYWRHLPFIEFMVDGTSLTIELLKTTNPHISFVLNSKNMQAILKPVTGINYILLMDKKEYPLSIYEEKLGTYEVRFNGNSHIISRTDISYVDEEIFSANATIGESNGNITSPMPGKVIKVNVQKGNTVTKGDVLLIVEAMKMENNILSNTDGIVETINVQQGDKVDSSTTLVKLSAKER